MLARTAQIIDGVAVSAKIRAECKQRVATLKVRGITPGLAVIIVGDDPASAVYVRNKMRAAAEVGIDFFRSEFAPDASPLCVLELISELNIRDDVHGILVQLPLPPQFSILKILRAISVDKDVDGFHLYNVGGLVVGERRSAVHALWRRKTAGTRTDRARRQKCRCGRCEQHCR